MSLEKTFRRVEKPAEEKKVEVITSVDAVVDELRDYFKKSRIRKVVTWPDCEEYFGSCMDFLKSFELKPEMITEFNTKMGSVKERDAFGVYLSALMQASYNQGFNNFVFGDVYAHGFGGFLKGQPRKPIKITTKELNGSRGLWHAINISLTAEMLKGHESLWYAKNCKLTAETIKGCFNLWKAKSCTLKTKLLEENYNLCGANSCLAEIQNYKGKYFGYYIKNCIIKSSSLKTLKLIKNQTLPYRENNKFELIK